MSSLMFWFMVGNIMSSALCLWAVYEAQQFLVTTEDMSVKTYKRANDILEKCLELEAKLQNDKRS